MNEIQKAALKIKPLKEVSREIRSFRHIAQLIREKRRAHPDKLSQNDVSEKMGYKNGQFISNIERGESSVPPLQMKKIAKILNISKEEILEALTQDWKESLSSMFDAEVVEEEAAGLSPNNNCELKIAA